MNILQFCEQCRKPWDYMGGAFQSKALKMPRRTVFAAGRKFDSQLSATYDLKTASASMIAFELLVGCHFSFGIFYRILNDILEAATAASPFPVLHDFLWEHLGPQVGAVRRHLLETRQPFPGQDVSSLPSTQPRQAF
jgi:hypothetical protein